MLSITALYAADHKPHAQRRVEGMNALVQEWKDLRARRQAHFEYDLAQRSRPIHDEQKSADSKKTDKERKVD